MSSTLNRSSALEHFERGNANEIRNRIMFDFYTGLPQVINFLIMPLIPLSLASGVNMEVNM